MTEAFRSDIVKGVFAEGGGHYATCFRMVERAIGLDLGDLDLRAIGMICELALDPPLPFLPEGAAAEWSWDTLHPGTRFRHLLDAAGQVGIFGGDGTAFDDQRMQLEVDLLARARLRRADHDAVRHWLGTYDEDTTEWPSQELGWQHAQMALLGRTEVTERPGVLQRPVARRRSATATLIL